MLIYDNDHIRESTPEEDQRMQELQDRTLNKYWLETPYDDLVNAEIRKKYSESQEFAVLRQKEEKPEEYRAYFDYCEQCKALVRQKTTLAI